jgi:hypothetical protein
MVDMSVAEVTLTAEDRCDRCNAPARTRTTLISGELFFCGHHARTFAAQLKPKSVSIYDPEGFFDVR